ncbi:MAG: hypothetical protein HRT88_22915 [Lentisphaeraceae bacterium]|nr:hypothetical protein [Lentisphaeraceae bacterium]
MYWNEIKKLSSAGGVVCGIIILAINLLRGHGLLHSSFRALLTMFVSAIIFLVALNGIGRILTAYLLEKKREADEEELTRLMELKQQEAEEHEKKLDEARKATQALQNKANKRQEQPT